ncbi:MAG: hypothetical protein Q9167_008147, partial [Letrouitia subvulpina]
SVNHDLGTRIQALSLAEYGLPHQTVTAITGVSRWGISRLRKQAIERGYNPDISKRLLLEYVEDKPRSGRPHVVTPDKKEAEATE